MHEFHSDLLALLPRMRRFAMALSNSVTDADALCGAAVDRALEMQGVDRQRMPLDRWMYRLVRDLWLEGDRLKARDAAASKGDPAVEVQVAMSDVARAMAKLTPQQREAAALVLVEGLSYRDAAAVLGTSADALSARLMDGRRTLMSHLGAAA